MSNETLIVDPCFSSAQTVPSPFIETTVRDVIETNVNRHSDKIAIVSDHENINKTFRQLFDDCCNLAENLVTTCGLKHGDHAAIATGCCYSYLVSYMACAIKGIVIWHYDPTMALAEVDKMVKRKKPVALFTMGLASPQNKFFPKMADIVNKFHSMGVKVVAVDGHPYPMSNCYHIDNLLGFIVPSSTQCQLTKPSDPLKVLVTSGSTGVPKLVLWPQGSYLAVAQYWRPRVGFKYGDKVCCPLSVHHAFAPYVLRNSLYTDHQVVLTGYKYSLTQTIACLVKYECNFVALVPTMLHDILAHVAKSGLKLNVTDILLSGAILTNQMVSKMTSIWPGIVCHQVYGSSEITCCAFATDHRFDSVGKPLADVKVKIVDDDGQIVPHGHQGRLLVSTKLGMLGYLNDDGTVNSDVYDAEGFFDTGDVFKMDAEGYLYCQGRVKDIINRDGAKVSPKEVEDGLLSISGVLDCVVIGIKDERLGEEIVAVVQTEPDCELSEQSVISSASDKISKMKVPRKVHVTADPLPRLSSFKHDKVKLRAFMSQKYS